MPRALEHFNAVVIGSGFGGSVVAHTLAEKGRTVCVLERGRPYPPGSFPRAPHSAAANFWDPSAGLYGMYNVWFFRRYGALVSSGLGGGSLIYANVLLRKDEKWFVREDLARGGSEYWPVTREQLDPHYARVERMLNPRRFPFDQQPYSQTEKVRAFHVAAGRLVERDPRRRLDLLPLAIAFANDGRAPTPGEVIPEPEGGRNLHGMDRRTCTLCGECVVGCNYGAKNTLDYNYLSAAKRNGAEIRTLCEVRSFRPRSGGGFEVEYVAHDLEYAGRPRDTKEMPRTLVTCDRLVLAAGAIGSTYLLLQNLHHLPSVNRAPVGTRFSGNGDLLAFALLCKRKRGGKVEPWWLDPTRGPTITSALREPDALDDGGPKVGRGFYVEDAGFPAQVAWLIEGLNTPGWLGRGLRLVRRILAGMLGLDRDPDLGAELADLLGPAPTSTTSLPLLAMGRDIPDGRMRLEGPRLQLDDAIGSSADYYHRVEAVAKEIVGELGGDFLLNPQTRFLRRLVTVHPLGGCPMGRNPTEGVVNEYGQVFGYPELLITDGSILPGPVGPNPSLTIAAIAERAALRLLEA
jgi:cholesterol oxidase